MQIITGSPQTGFVDVNFANSIDNRLVKLLEYLAAKYPREGWARFLDDGAPVWPHIVVSGLSQGAGHAAMIGKLRLVDRVLMFSGVTDGIDNQAARWVATDATSADRYYGLAHDRDVTFFQVIAANWVALGLDAFGKPRMPETSVPPYHGTHMLITDILPTGGSYEPPVVAHSSTAADFATPLAADGTPLLRDAWDYMLGARRSHHRGDDNEHDRDYQR